MAQINAAGLALLKNFEGWRATTYDDGTGVLTIGYGHTGDDVKPGMVISEQQGEALLSNDVKWAENGVISAVEVELTPNQFSALVCFVFNVGVPSFEESTMRKLINSNEISAAANEFPEWVYAGGQPLPGLLRRREAERQLFLTPG